MHLGTEHFYANGHELQMSMSDFWHWAYSDLTNNISRSVLAEYIVATALTNNGMTTDANRTMWQPYDLYCNKSDWPSGLRIEVKSAAYVQSWDAKHPDRISFRIAPARMPDETGDYKLNAPLQRNSDVYIFCVYKAMSKDESPLNLDLWEFYVLPTDILNEKKPTQKTITLQSLLQLEPVWSDYNGLGEAINAVKRLS